MLEIFDKTKKNTIDETHLLVALVEDECELLLMNLLNVVYLLHGDYYNKRCPYMPSDFIGFE
jgi:hypothetical protein